MNRDQAAEEFVRVITHVGYTSATESVLKSIAEQQPRGHDREEEKELRKWVAECPPSQQHLFKLLIEESVRTSLFHVFAFLDGVSGYHYIDEKPVEFPVAFKMYRDFESKDEGETEVDLQFAPTESGDDMHDLFLNLLDDLKNGVAKPLY